MPSPYFRICRMSSTVLSVLEFDPPDGTKLTPGQKADTGPFFGDGSSWGFGMAVATRRTDLWSVGRFGWDGGLGTSGYSDPKENLVGVLMTQRAFDSPVPPPAITGFWKAVYGA